MAAKGKRETPPRAPKYHRLTEEKRIIIETLRKEGRSCRHIAGRIGCAPSTVTRELGRNGIVRKVLPKGRPFDDITGEEMRRIDRMLNDRPLKCLNWRTPREAFTELLRRHLLKAA